MKKKTSPLAYFEISFTSKALLMNAGRDYLQGLRPFHDPNLLLFLHSLPILYFVRKLYRNCSKRYTPTSILDSFFHYFKNSKSRQRTPAGKR